MSYSLQSCWSLPPWCSLPTRPCPNRIRTSGASLSPDQRSTPCMKSPAHWLIYRFSDLISSTLIQVSCVSWWPNKPCTKKQNSDMRIHSSPSLTKATPAGLQTSLSAYRRTLRKTLLRVSFSGSNQTRKSKHGCGSISSRTSTEANRQAFFT